MSIIGVDQATNCNPASHSSKDREFVERLYADLQSNGVRCWYAPEDLKIGEPFLLGDDLRLLLLERCVSLLEASTGAHESSYNQ